MVSSPSYRSTNQSISMKTLLQINAACNYGSTGRIAENIGLLAQNQGWKCYIAHGTRYVKQTQLCDICTETSWGERMHALRSFLLDEHGLGSKQATLLLIRKIQQISPDIIHLHNIHGYYLNYPLLFNFLSTTNIPIVWTLHDCWPITGHCTYFNRIHCDKWKTYCDKCPQLKAYPKSLIRDNSANNYSLKRELFLSVKQHLHLIPVSDWLMNILNHSFLNDVPMTRIHNGVDLTIFTPQIQVDPKKKVIHDIRGG